MKYLSIHKYNNGLLSFSLMLWCQSMCCQKLTKAGQFGVNFYQNDWKKFNQNQFKIQYDKPLLCYAIHSKYEKERKKERVKRRENQEKMSEINEDKKNK